MSEKTLDKHGIVKPKSHKEQNFPSFVVKSHSECLRLRYHFAMDIDKNINVLWMGRPVGKICILSEIVGMWHA